MAMELGDRISEAPSDPNRDGKKIFVNLGITNTGLPHSHLVPSNAKRTNHAVDNMVKTRIKYEE